MTKEKADDKRMESLTQCTGLVEEVTYKRVNHMATFPLGKLKIFFVITLAAMYTGMRRIRRITKRINF